MIIPACHRRLPWCLQEAGATLRNDVNVFLSLNYRGELLSVSATLVGFGVVVKGEHQNYQFWITQSAPVGKGPLSSRGLTQGLCTGL